MGDINKKSVGEYENKINIMNEEIKRLNIVMDKKNNEIRSLGGEVKEAQ